MWGDTKMKWTRMAITGMLALATVGAPLASARDRCDRGYDNRTSYRYENRGYSNGSYGSGYTYRDSGYSNYGNRSYGYSSYGNNNYGYNNGYGYQQPRWAGKSAAIIGGSAAAGAVVGALTGGGKGAAIGAVVGGIGGVVVDQATRSRNNYGRRW